MNITLVFFIYGLAFFSLGLVLWLESSRSPFLADASTLRPLALFGLMHGVHEWLEMFVDHSDWLLIHRPVELGWLRIGLLSVSFISLLVFGLRMIRPMRLMQTPPESQPSPRPLRAVYWLALGGYSIGVLGLGLFFPLEHADRLTHLDASLRYALAAPAAVLSGLALLRQASQARRQELSALSQALRLAGLGFLLYALTQCVAPPIDTFPGNWLNTASFLQTTGLPIQAVRAGCAVLITACMIRVIQSAEQERQRQFVAAQQERVAALEQAQAELVKREAMRQELIRSIVRAQEDERARIARELHDETSQILTAFSLHLAALRSLEPSGPRCEKIDLLQGLSRQMSLGLYRLVYDLRPAQLDDLGLPPALNYLTTEVQKRLGLKVTLQVNGERQRLAPLTEIVIFRIAQEALTNTARHAQTDQASLTLDYLPGHIRLTVTDQGAGFAPGKDTDAKSLGLAGMRERAELIGAQLTIFSAPGQGTRVEMAAPYAQPEAVE